MAANAGLLENPGTMGPQNTRNVLLEVPKVPGMGRVSAATGRQAGATVSTVALNTPFPTQTLQRNDQFSNHDEALYDQGFDSEGERMFYNPVALYEDADDFLDQAI